MAGFAKASKEKVDMHWLPCAIDHTGEVPVNDYFLPRASGSGKLSGSEAKEAAFRGRRLRGATMMLPEHYSGFVLKREESLHEKSSSQSKPSWSTAGTFDKFSYWNHDTPASSMDTAPRVVEWLALADLVHAPVTCEQIEAQLLKSSQPSAPCRNG